MPALASAQSFGRFGFREIPDSDLYAWDRTGFRVRHARADWLKFLEPTKPWKPVQVNRYEAVYNLPGDRAFCPSQVRISCLAPSFELFFPKGIWLQSSAFSAPFLTWPDGSAGAKVPVPASKWVCVSYADDQPPVLLSFPENSASLTVMGQPGKWRVVSSDKFSGWVRVSAPLGATGFAASDAAGLGILAEKLAALPAYWHTMMPYVKGTAYTEVPGGVLATWQFSGPGVIVPPPLLASDQGGYTTVIQSKIDALPNAPKGLPQMVTETEMLKVFFPMVPRLKSRILAPTPPALVAGLDPENPPAIFEEAIRNLAATRSKDDMDRGMAIVSDYNLTAPIYKEATTQVMLPFDKTGRNMTVVASHALLNRSQDLSDKPNDFFERCLRTLDWTTWTLDPEPMETRRRTTAFLSLAGALGTTSERAMAGMLRAGLCAERAIKRKEVGPMLEVLADTCNAVFTSDAKDPWFSKVSQNLKLLSGDRIQFTKDRTYSAISWVAGAAPLAIWLGRDIEIMRIQGNKFFERKAQDGGQVITIHAPTGAACTLTLKEKGKTGDFLSAIGLPRYSESIR